MAKFFNSADQLIGKTPLLKLNNLRAKSGYCADIYAKLEFFNPAGSIKDRVAKAILDDAEERGVLKAGVTVIEPTSGNTGIGLASVAAARGYKVIIVMPDTMSKERRKILRAYGAKLVLTDGKLGMKGAIEEAERIRENTPNSFVAGQFANPANPRAHYLATGREIYEDLDGNVDILVAGVGTGGTISGAGAYLKEKNPAVKIVAVEPSKSAVLSGKGAGAHGLQGIGAGFMPQTLDRKIYDEVIAVSEEDAYSFAQAIALAEGVLVGISSGAAAWAAARVASRPENKGKNIAVIFPDGGDRYLSVEGFLS